MPLKAKGEILKNQANWDGYAEMAEAAVAELKAYIRNLFTQKEGKK